MPSPTVDLLLRSDLILTPSGLLDGYLAVADGHVVAVEPGPPSPTLVAGATEVLDLTGRLVTPGFVDVHTFFPGWLAEREGVPLEDAGPLLADPVRVREGFAAYQALLHSRGVTTVKEMAFDDGGGIPELLVALDAEDALSLRVHVMSQPVEAALDVSTGRRLDALLTGPRLRFSGFNVMTDGSLSDHEADLLDPYVDGAPGPEVDWDGIARAVLDADRAGFRVALHAQGDAAVRRSLDVLGRCRRDTSGRLLLRHALTDLEMTDPADVRRMAELGVVAEIYPQITSRRTRAQAAELLDATVGPARRDRFWRRRAMADAGVALACATDLPLLVPDVPASVDHACRGLFADGAGPLVEGGTLTPEELVHAWTSGGAWDLGAEAEIGALAAGRRADIAVLDANVLAPDGAAPRATGVVLTVAGGRIVHRA
ncbi:amidohydrolase family protein [Actinotalea subterranea]|uniref:amidohydrolase family protein n=1 Tax=Actinotalea subterranea TaxID=2607497 RepID=UPI0011EE2B00|nr:amidohydrolase family protein [Actinotalea subterranea]